MNRRAVFKNLLALPAAPAIAEEIERERIERETAEYVKKLIEDYIKEVIERINIYYVEIVRASQPKRKNFKSGVVAYPNKKNSNDPILLSSE